MKGGREVGRRQGGKEGGREGVTEGGRLGGKEGGIATCTCIQHMGGILLHELRGHTLVYHCESSSASMATCISCNQEPTTRSVQAQEQRWSKHEPILRSTLRVLAELYSNRFCCEVGM